MTTTQIQYWNLQESKRHSKETEAQGRHSLSIQEGQLQLGRDSLTETNRHNLATEGIQRNTLSETIRHNKKGESISSKQLKETKRHNKAEEKIGSTNAKANTKNAATNAKNAESNAKQAAAALQNAETNAKHVQYEFEKLSVDTMVAEANVSKAEAETMLTTKKYDKYTLELLSKSGVLGDALSAIMLMSDEELYSLYAEEYPDGVAFNSFSKQTQKNKKTWNDMNSKAKKSWSSIKKWFKGVDKNLEYVILHILGIPKDNWK